MSPACSRYRASRVWPIRAACVVACWAWASALPARAGDCWNQAAHAYGIDAKLLYVIAKRESGLNPTAMNRNRDGSVDIGIMQINSRWLPLLRRYGIDRERLFDRCTNERVGAWILAGNIAQYGATWRAIGGYNARTVGKQRVYAKRIFESYYETQSALEAQGAASVPAPQASAQNGPELRRENVADQTVKTATVIP